MIEIENVTKTFGQENNAFTALRDVYLTIQQNEFFTLLGPSGCGKTTLLRAIAGFVDPTAGRIALEGKDLLALPPYSRPVNTVFQNYALFPHMTVAQNVAFGLEMLNKHKSEVRQTVNEMLTLVRMDEMADRKTSQISGGQQQRVALARALAPKPKVLLLDEPLSALDFKLRKEMQMELKRLQSETGITFVFVTHDQEEALAMSDRIAVMREGRILQVDAPRAIYDHPADRFVADFIGDSNFLTAEIVSVQDHNATLNLDAGGSIVARRPPGGPSEGRVTISIRPEHASFAPLEDAVLSATVVDILYSGTDTQYYLHLQDGQQFVIRMQNRPDSAADYKKGSKAGITFGSDIAQILND